MRTASSIFLLSVLLLNLFGFYFAFTSQQSEIQKDMVCKSKTKHHQVLSLSKTEFEKIVWLDDEKEMRFNGKLYDVSKIETANNTVKLFVEEDSMETQLVDDFVALFTSQNNQPINSSPVKNLLQHFMQEFTCHASTTIFHPYFSFVALMERDSLFNSFVTIGQSPPPDFIRA